AGGAIGWGIQFQQPWFLSAMALVTTLFAASLWEWLPVPMPGFAGRITSRGNENHNSGVTAFITGALASVLAISCTAPFIGTAVGFALARGPLTIVGIFTALGFGMGMPYLAIAAIPGLVGWLPKPGIWMNKLRIILGFMLLGTAVWLLSVIVAVVSARAALITGVVLSIILLLLFMRHQRRTDGLLLRWTMTGLTAGLAVIAVVLPSFMPQTIIDAPSPGASVATIFRPFDRSRINALLAQNKLVFVDVTAAWCLVCKVNALTVLDRDPVAAQLRAANVVAMRADWTRPSPIITAYLESFHRYGVPLDVVYGPGALSGILLPSLLTSGAVMDAFRRAGTALNSTSQTEASQ
ncbi:MAG: thioredoxin family protein, partial [Rhodospirillales bacterium]|nr:thioredoxin family protein [Rhodospirillales bacterium]